MLHVTPGRKGAPTSLKCHWTHCRQAKALQEAAAEGIRPGGAERLGRRPRGGVRAKLQDVRFSLLKAHYRRLFTQIRGLWIHMWTYPLLNFQQKGHLAGRAKPRHRGHMPRENLFVGSPDAWKEENGEGSALSLSACGWTFTSGRSLPCRAILLSFLSRACCLGNLTVPFPIDAQ